MNLFTEPIRARLIIIVSLFFVLTTSCDEEDDSPPTAEPAAAFSFTANELTVTFSNTSTDATSHTWDFGDGNTSNEANPVHTYAEGGTYNVKLTARNGELSSETSQSVVIALNPENVRLKSGFILSATTPDNTWFAQYFEEIPTGTVDISQGTAFQEFFPLSIIDGAIYLSRTDGSAGFEKLGINGNNEFIEDGIISTISDGSFVIAARDAEFGVFHDRNDPNVINTFNPTTMDVTGTIDMSVANAIVEDPVRYQDFIFRGDNEIFAPMRLEAGGNVPNVGLARIDISAGSTVDVVEFEGLGEVVVLNSSRRFFDEDGNFYFFHAGNISFPTLSGAILKIPAGSNDYDPEYDFKVPEVNNPAVIGAGSFMSSFNYWKDNLGFAIINESLDPRILELVTERGGIQNVTPEDLEQIQVWLFTSPTGAIVQVDVLNLTVTKIGGLPAVSVFDTFGVSFIDDKPYFSVANPEINALYEFDEASGTVNKVFDVVGAQIGVMLDLSSTIQ
ncbi:MAG: PKD domain-containing protein [Bacteroidota bacterium]